MIEICANSALSAIEAQRGGAHRVELCASLPEGGTTPSYGEIKLARANISIKLNVIIRPRGGDFLYSPFELELMEADIQMAKHLNADGVVFGCLDKYGNVDRNACEILLKEADGMSTTFHRAFDMCCDPHKALEDIIELGFDRILTSGCKASALEGKDLIKQLVQQANGRITIMPGCGVNENNIAHLAEYTGANEFHLSAKERIDSQMEYLNPCASMGGVVKIEEYSIERSSANRIANTIKALNTKR